MNKSVLWFQPAKLNEPDIILVDGKKAIAEERDCSFGELINLFSYVLKESRPWCGSKKIGGVRYHFVKGSLDRQDEKGRFLSFDFVAKEDCWKDELSKSIHAIGVNMTNETKKCTTPWLRRVLERNK